MTPDVGSLRAALADELLDAVKGVLEFERVNSVIAGPYDRLRLAYNAVIREANALAAEPVTPEPDNPHPPRDIAWGMPEPAPSEREAQTCGEVLGRGPAKCVRPRGHEGYHEWTSVPRPRTAAGQSLMAWAHRWASFSFTEADERQLARMVLDIEDAGLRAGSPEAPLDWGLLEKALDAWWGGDGKVHWPEAMPHIRAEYARLVAATPESR